MKLHWRTSDEAAGFHAADQLRRGRPPRDERLAEALREPVHWLECERADEGLPAGLFWGHLVALAAEPVSPRQLAERVLIKLRGRDDARRSVGRFERALAGVRAGFRRAKPPAVSLSPPPPLQMAWNLHGPGLLTRVTELTEPGLLVEEAVVYLLPPIAEGGGAAPHLPYNAVRIELTEGEDPGLPEVVRLAWLLAQLNLDLPRYREGLSLERLDQTTGLAMLPVALSAGEHLKLTSCTPGTITRAVRAWLADDDRAGALSEVVAPWWEAYQAQRPPWAAALAALERLTAEG